MAALPEWSETRVVDLRKISADDLGPLLEEETLAWKAALRWDLQPSANLVRRFVRMQALNGFALLHRARVIGYAYYVLEDYKGLIGDLYILERERTPDRERNLIHACVDAMLRTPGIRRLETQFLLSTSVTDEKMPYAHLLRRFPRWYLQIRSADALRLEARELQGVETAPWLESCRDDAARLIASAYQGHIDSEINDQYRSAAGSRRFLNNIIEYPGCGAFFGPASLAALDRRTGALCGLSLTSLIAPDSGHLTQLCVSPAHQGLGVGYELLRRSLILLAGHGCRTVSLTVTAANSGAIQLYEAMGFKRHRAFQAHVWELQ